MSQSIICALLTVLPYVLADGSGRARGSRTAARGQAGRRRVDRVGGLLQLVSARHLGRHDREEQQAADLVVGEPGQRRDRGQVARSWPARPRAPRRPRRCRCRRRRCRPADSVPLKPATGSPVTAPRSFGVLAAAVSTRTSVSGAIASCGRQAAAVDQADRRGDAEPPQLGHVGARRAGERGGHAAARSPRAGPGSRRSRCSTRAAFARRSRPAAASSRWRAPGRTRGAGRRLRGRPGDGDPVAREQRRRTRRRSCPPGRRSAGGS